MGVRNDDVGNLQCHDISGAKTFKSVVYATLISLRDLTQTPNMLQSGDEILGLKSPEQGALL